MPATRELLSGVWELGRAALPAGARAPESPVPETTREGLPESVELPGNLQLQLGFEDVWLDTPELTNLNH